MVFPLFYDLYGLLPELFLLGGTTTLLLFGVFFEKTNSTGSAYFSVSTVSNLSLLVVFFTFLLCLNQCALFVPVAFDSFVVDGFARFMKLLLLLLLFLFLLLLVKGYSRDRLLPFEYPLLILLSALGYLLLLGSYNLLMLYLALELSSFSLYILASFKRFSLQSTESGLKYFILGAFSSGLLLFGITVIYGSSGTISFSDLSLLYSTSEALPSGFLFGIFLLLFGLIFKLGVAPFHLWVPDVYDGAPTPVVAYFATVSKIAVFGVVLRLVYEVLPAWFQFFNQFFLLVGVVSIVVGTLGALAQSRIKRLIAYSGIVHSGFLLLAVSTGTFLGSFSAILYLLVYTLLNLNFFAVLLSVRRVDSNLKLRDLSDLYLLLRSDPVSAASLSLNLFSMAGIPPLAGFFSKLYVLLALIHSGYYLIGLVVVLLTVASAVYYLRLIRIMFFEVVEKPIRMGFFYPYTVVGSLVLVFSTGFNLLFLFFQTPIFSLLSAAF